ncbi:hypothetical protein CTEN210_03722 [Chaetoceros tenuissimus]|uniref:Fatty acyl-CoA reductase n=1 Tax=Chaetoceros tenuissimus TaxID=426638 RepID=A0AAD3CJH9_9STRA|nr:hypothetical protein CTEN210_03722 [Chaetoceros tenuissimus]
MQNPNENVKNVFLIGSTGFIGKVTLGMLLERRDVDKVFILIRPREKKSDFNTKVQNVMDRFQHLKTNPCLASKACQQAFSDGRVIPVVGDLSLENLGLSAADCDRMTALNHSNSSSNKSSTSLKEMLGYRTECDYDMEKGITHIINLAADVSFEKSLSEAVINNVGTSMNVWKFAKRCKHLRNFVHCSTAYVAPSHGKERDVNDIKERLHDISRLSNEYGDAMTIYNNIKRGLLNSKEKDLMTASGHNNSYAFSKYLTENVLAEKCKGSIPLTIVRPSIVSVSLNFPAPGWTDSHDALNGPLALYGAGFLHTNIGNNGSLFDVVPCDYVADRLISAAFETCSSQIEEKRVRIIHVTAGKQNGIENPALWKIMEDFWHPHNRKKVILRPFLRQLDYMKMDKSIKKDTQHLLRIKLFLLLIGKRRLARKLEKIIPLLQKLPDLFGPFCYYRYDFLSENSIQDYYPTFNNKDYSHLICQGIHYYLLKRGEQSPDNREPKYGQRFKVVS